MTVVWLEVFDRARVDGQEDRDGDRGRTEVLSFLEGWGCRDERGVSLSLE